MFVELLRLYSWFRTIMVKIKRQSDKNVQKDNNLFLIINFMWLFEILMLSRIDDKIFQKRIYSNWQRDSNICGLLQGNYKKVSILDSNIWRLFWSISVINLLE